MIHNYEKEHVYVDGICACGKMSRAKAALERAKAKTATLKLKLVPQRNHTEFEETQTQVVDLKSQINPATNQGYTHAEIAHLLGFKSPQALMYYIRELREGRCPCCLRKLRKEKQTTKEN